GADLHARRSSAPARCGGRYALRIHAVLRQEFKMNTITRMLVLLILPTALLAEPANVAGKWNAALELENITGHPVLIFKQDGEKLTGTYEGRYGVSNLKGTIKEKQIDFTVIVIAEGTQTQGVFSGTVDGDSMHGSVSFEGAGEGTWTASRAPVKK